MADYILSGDLSITIFVLVVTGGLIALPFIVGRNGFSKNVFVDTIFRRGCWVVGLYLMSLNSAIMATIATHTGLTVNQEMFMYMWLFGWGGYLMMFYLAFKTLLDLLEMWKMKKMEERTGGVR